MTNLPGISGIAAYFPAYKVNLRDWCLWTGASWDKTRAVVGNSFRMPGDKEDVYTMAASAALRLIHQYDLDPGEITYIGLGTESSADNSAGAIIIKGMLDEALLACGKPPISRHCEVPEFKHACLGSVYALKSALRYLSFDGKGSKALVISADIAQYERNSSGEPTQGAGAIAMLLESDPRLLGFDLHHAGNSSAYRCLDFRKPMARFTQQTPLPSGHIKDLPLFNGKYSTSCYIDAVMQAALDMFSRLEEQPAEFLKNLSGVFMHRPYQNMPLKGWALIYLLSLARGNAAHQSELAGYCQQANVTPETVIQELKNPGDLLGLVRDNRLDDELLPVTMRVLNAFKQTAAYKENVTDKMKLGITAAADMGNLYTASLPAWLAAGLEEAMETGINLAGSTLLSIGYGSGDAAEVIPVRVVPGWEKAARLMNIKESMATSVDLDQANYETLHDHGRLSCHPANAVSRFEVERIGKTETDRDIAFYHHLTD
ncbi:MAG: hydroxymethylglutaryl-CoA synthase [Gammaproteobacteria bacterium]|nr:hydroxymethylglutaryl-CoA synthase [Gammaproteobacteria bacterium]